MLVSSPVREREKERKREEVFPYLFYFTCHSFHTCLLVHHHNVSSSPTGSAGCPTRVARLIGIYRPGQEAIRRASSGLGKAEERVLRIPMANLGSRLPSGQCHCSKRMVGARDKLHISTGPCRIIADECSHQRGALSTEEREDYIQATRCLYTSPAQSPQDYAPGARNRRDDFVAVHIAQQQRIHFSPWTLPFHRWYVHLYEQALRDECGYKGGMIAL